MCVCVYVFCYLWPLVVYGIISLVYYVCVCVCLQFLDRIGYCFSLRWQEPCTGWLVACYCFASGGGGHLNHSILLSLTKYG
uniref:Uncharacterized protein n=1 Tax=Octopus bimaculoides TaxID=37653 RepID=A0A0L8GWW3_OCTBM